MLQHGILNSNNMKTCHLTMKIIEYYLIDMRQRKDNNNYNDIFSKEICPITHNKIKYLRNKNDDDTILASCVSMFGLINGNDWENILSSKDDDDDEKCNLLKITNMSLEHCNNNNKISSTACKSIGEFCTERRSSFG